MINMNFFDKSNNSMTVYSIKQILTKTDRKNLMDIT